MPNIFISYRRQDSGTFTGRIHDHLKAYFGVNNVFRDVYNIPAGSDFRSVLNKEVSNCDIFLVIIGPHWLNITGLSGSRRLDDPNDFVRVEVESALHNPNILVVPVLVDNASMPTEGELPEGLKELAYRNAVKVRTDPDFPHDMEILVRQLKRSKSKPISRILWSVIVFALLLFTGTTLFSFTKGFLANASTVTPAELERSPTTQNLIPSTEPEISFTVTTQINEALEIVEIATPVPTVEPVGPDEIMVLVAQIDGAEDGGVSQDIINDLERRFKDELPNTANIRNVHIRKYEDIIRTKEEASQIAEQYHAVILIWGDYDNDVARITVQLGSLTSRPDLLIDRDILDRTVTVRVKMANVHEETLAYPILTTLSFLYSAENNFIETIRLIMALNLLEANRPQIDEGSIATHLHKASLSFLSDKEYAIGEVSKAINSDANNPLLYMFRGLLYQEIGDFSQSDLDTSTALKMAPEGWVMPYHINGIESLILNDPTKGIEAYSRIIEKRSDDWLPYNQRGYLYILAGQSELALGNIEKSFELYELARLDIEKSIKLGPDAEWPYMWATLIALRQGRINDISVPLQVISQTKQSDFIKNLMTTMYGEEKATLLGYSMSTMEQLSKGQFLFAIQYADAVLAVMPNYAEMHLLKGLSYCNLDDYVNAEAAYTEGLNKDPSFTILYLLRAEVRGEPGNSEGAGEDLVTFVQQSPLYEDMKDYLAATQSEQYSCKQLISSE